MTKASDARDVATVANMFLMAARRLDQVVPMPGGQVQMLPLPAAVCAAFSSELSLKAIMAFEGFPSRGHRLDRLFAQISLPVRSRIVAALNVDDATFQTNLAKVANTFSEWRYVYEKSSAELNLAFLYQFTDACYDAYVDICAKP